jgi:FAD/FMN-containing dehydrogenase
MSRWPRTRKNTAGYGLDRYWKSGDLLDLVVGSEGTLGVITHADLRLEPIPTQRASLRIALADRGDLEAVIDVIKVAAPGTIELLDRSLLRLMVDRLPAVESASLWQGAAALLLVDLESDDAGELADRVKLATAVVGNMALDVRAASAPADIAELWSVRHLASPALAALTDGRRSLQVIEDGCVPIQALGRYLDAVEQACREATMEAVMFGHAGDGHVHVNLLPDIGTPDWLVRVEAIWQRVTAALLELGGTPAGEHGAGRLRAGQLEQFLGPEAMACFGAIKRAFDPQDLFNPGVIVPDGRDPLADLKVGPQAAALPTGQEDALRRIEEQRRWGESRWE